MARHSAWRLGAVAILAPAIAACSLLERMEGQPEPTTGTGAAVSFGVPSPAASEPIAVPDPLNPLTHQVGEEVQVAGATIVYLGLTDATEGVVAQLRILDGSLGAGPRLLTSDGRVLGLSPRGDVLESEPFDAPSGVDATLTLIVGEALVVFERGPLP